MWLRAQMAVGLKQLSEFVDGYLIELIIAKINLQGRLDARFSIFYSWSRKLLFWIVII